MADQDPWGQVYQTPAPVAPQKQQPIATNADVWDQTYKAPAAPRQAQPIVAPNNGILSKVTDAGFGLLNGIGNAPKDIYNTVTGLYNSAQNYETEHPVNTPGGMARAVTGAPIINAVAPGVWDGMAANWKKATKDSSSGNDIDALVHLAASIPFASPIGDIYDKFKNGDVNGGSREIGSAIGQALLAEGLGKGLSGAIEGAQAGTGVLKGAASGLADTVPAKAAKALSSLASKSPEAASGAMRGVQDAVTDRLGEVLDKVRNPDPDKQVMQGLRGSAPSNRPNFQNNIKTLSMPEIAQQAASEGVEVGKSGDAFKDLIGDPANPGDKGLVGRAQQRLMSVVENSKNGRGANAVDMAPVGQAIKDSVTKSLKVSDPAAAARIEALGDRWAKTPATLDDLQGYLHDANRELITTNNKTPQAQYAAMSNEDMAALNARRNAVQKLLYDTLDNTSGLTGDAREAMKRYGALTEFREALGKRRIVDARQAPENLQQQLEVPRGIIGTLGSGAKAMGSFARGDIAGAAGHVADSLGAAGNVLLSNAYRDLGSSNSLFTRAFKRFQGSGYNFGTPKPQSVAGLLQAPAPAITNGSISGPIPNPGPIRNPGFHTPSQTFNGQKALPAGGPNPAESALGSPAGDVTDLIPMKGPNGKTIYVSRKQAQTLSAAPKRFISTVQ